MRRNTVRGGPGAMGTGNMHRNRVKLSCVVFELCERADKQTDKQTDILFTIFRTLPSYTTDGGRQEVWK